MIWTGSHCHNENHHIARFQTCGPANALPWRSGGGSESESKSGPSVKPWFFSSPRYDDEGECRKSNRNHDSGDGGGDGNGDGDSDGNGDTLGDVGNFTPHMVSGSGVVPSFFAISVPTALSTGVEILSSRSMETSWLTWFSLSGSEEEVQRKEGVEVKADRRYSCPASKTESAMGGVLSALPYPPSFSWEAVKPEILEKKKDDSDPVSEDGASGGTSPLDGGILGSNSKAGVSGDGDHTDEQGAFLRNGPAAAGGPESDDSALEEEVDDNNDDDGLFLLFLL